MPQLQDRIAVVTGASRGAGRGIALQLGEAGATVYVTGRSTARATTTDGPPGTVEETAAEVGRRGGEGIAVPCDHGDPTAVEALIARVRGDHGRLDLLVNNAWGGYEQHDLATFASSFWQAPTDHWEKMIQGGVRLTWLTSRQAAPLMIERGRGLIVTTTSWYGTRYARGLVYDLARAAVHRMTHAMAAELRPHGVAAVAVAPGFMRTERVLAAFGASEATWRDHPGLRGTETPEYVGRCVARLAADPDQMAKSGRVFGAGHLAAEYGLTDVDGRLVPPFAIPDELLLD